MLAPAAIPASAGATEETAAGAAPQASTGTPPQASGAAEAAGVPQELPAYCCSEWGHCSQHRSQCGL